MKRFTLLKTMLLLCALIVGSGSAWAETKTETFENATTSTTYNSTVTVAANKSSCGIAWSIYYGTVSTNDKISGSNSAQMRYYNSASSNYPYIKTTTPIDNLTHVAFKARTDNSNMKFDISYSTDGETWNVISSENSFSETGKGLDFGEDIPNGGKYIMISVHSGITVPPSKGNYKLIIDDVTFTYTAKTTTTTTINETGITKTDLKDGTDAGSLTASVTAGGTPVAGAEISWSSDDESVATVNESTGAVTLIGEGTTTITATYAGNADYLESSATYDLTVNDTRTATVTTISTTGITNTDVASGTSAGTLTATVTAGGEAVAGAAVTWSSSDPTIATINETTGAVTLVKAGSTTITATYAGTGAYKTSSSSCVLSVTDSNQEKEVEISLNNSFFGTSYDGSLKADQKTALKNAGGYVEGTSKNITVRYNIGTSSNFYINDASIRTYDGTNIVVTAPSGYYVTSVQFVEPTSDKGWSGSSNTSTPSGYNDSNKKWTGASNTVTINFGGTCRMVGINVTLAQIATISINAACTDGEGNIYGTYSNAKSFIVPEGLTVSAVGISDGKLVVTAYEEGAIVKAGTGVMVSAESDINVDKVILLSDEDGTEISGNLLKASGDAGIAAAAMASAAPSCKYYRLTMHNPAAENKIGFWWGAPDGDAFDVAANKAYLAVPDGATSRSGFNLFGDDDTTGIEAVDVNTENANVAREYYNLNGQRIANPSKGLYIVNGKKVIIK